MRPCPGSQGEAWLKYIPKLTILVKPTYNIPLQLCVFSCECLTHLSNCIINSAYVEIRVHITALDVCISYTVITSVVLLLHGMKDGIETIIV